jgi:hypothetical protein
LKEKEIERKSLCLVSSHGKALHSQKRKHLFEEQTKENKAQLSQNCPAGTLSAMFETRNLEKRKK